MCGKYYPIQGWDRLIPQFKPTLNLLRNFCLNTILSSWTIRMVQMISIKFLCPHKRQKSLYITNQDCVTAGNIMITKTGALDQPLSNINACAVTCESHKWKQLATQWDPSLNETVYNKRLNNCVLELSRYELSKIVDKFFDCKYCF